MDPKYYIGSKPLSFYGFGNEYIEKAQRNTLNFLNNKNDFEVGQSMTPEQRRRYIAYNMDTKINSKQREQYNRTLQRPVNPELFSSVTGPTSPAVDTVSILAPFSGIINQWLRKKGQVGLIMSVDAQKRLYLLESVEEWKARNNIKDDRETINILKAVTIPNKPGFYLFLDANENIAQVLNEMPSLTLIDKNKIPQDSFLSQPISFTSPEIQQQTIAEAQQVIAKDTLGRDVIISKMKAEEEAKLEAFKKAQKKKEKGPDIKDDERAKMREKALESALRRQRLIEEANYKTAIELETKSGIRPDIEEIIKILTPEQINDIEQLNKKFKDEETQLEKSLIINEKQTNYLITGEPKQDQEQIKKLLLFYENDKKELSNVDLGKIITQFYNVYRNGNAKNVSSYFTGANKKRLVKDLETGDLEQVFRDLQKQKEYRK